MTWELPPQSKTASVSAGALDVRIQMLLPDLQTLVRKLIVLADVAASVIEARSGETAKTGSTEGESAVPKADAQTPIAHPERREDKPNKRSRVG